MEKKDLKGSEARSQLKTANEAYTSCISAEFLTKFMSGADVKIENFCVQERQAMEHLDHSIYGKLPF